MPKIVIYLPDTVYMVRLARYLKQIKSLGYQIISIEQIEALRKLLRTTQVELMIIPYGMVLKPEYIKNIHHIVYLSEENTDFEEITYNEKGKNTQEKLEEGITVSESNISGQKIRCVKAYQYQSIDHIISKLSQMNFLLKSQHKSNQESNKKQVVVSIITMEHIQEEVNAAWQAAEVMSDHYKTIHLNMTQLEGRVQEESKNGQNLCMSDFIYYLKEKEEHTQMMEMDSHEIEQEAIPLNQMLCKTKHFDYIRGVNHGLDLLELCGNDVKGMLEELSLAGYEAVVVHVDVMSEAIIELLARSKAIIYVHSPQIPVSWQDIIRRQLQQVLPEEKWSNFHVLTVEEDWTAVKMRSQLQEQLEGCYGCIS